MSDIPEMEDRLPFWQGNMLSENTNNLNALS